MAWPHLSGMVKVVMTYGFDGKPSINVHFVLMDTPQSPIPTSVLEAVAAAFYNAWNSNWKTRAHAEWTVDEIQTIDWGQEDGASYDRVTGLPITGQESTSDPCPPSVAMVASHRTGLTGRSRRGRNYIPGSAQAEVDGKDFSTSWPADIASVYAGLYTGLSAIDCALVVYSLYEDGAQRTTPLATPVTSSVIDTLVDTQRRRLN